MERKRRSKEAPFSQRGVVVSMRRPGRYIDYLHSKRPADELLAARTKAMEVIRGRCALFEHSPATMNPPGGSAFCSDEDSRQQ